ncbi:hexosaminidase D [Eurytemora carolleeae]|uniref:hexosaminidase D n=1 Tax=Eurytemora carolleeae TaxID=1294199 RepID=UPI000C78DFE9|nr:hexosaminidase D [Eurytemora carolleeae]|eukprot:XP_023324784.1 hexosaminidase D-like [Eurytemora affinis]
MFLFFRFLGILLRKKLAFWGLLTGLVLFIFCFYTNSIIKHTRESSPEHYVGVHKRLQQSNDIDVDPVQFIPGVPGLSRSARKLVPNQQDVRNSRQNIFQEEALKHSYNGDQAVETVEKGREVFSPQSSDGEDNVEFSNNQIQFNAYGKNPGYIEIGKNSRNDPPVYFNQADVNLDGYQNQQGGFASSSEPYIPEQRIVHLDFKGAPPSVSYLKQILPMVKDLGATGILWEWEDTFPFTGRLAAVSTSNHYTVEEVKPAKRIYRSGKQLQEYIDQVMKLHTGAKYVHIGCDEVYHLGTCEPCLDQSRTVIFIDHVSRTAKYVITKYISKPIVWDDMLRNFMEDEMLKLASLVEPMVWVYAEDVYRFMPPYTWERYAQVFPYLWTASAFKGAHGETLVVPDAKRHLVNNLYWINVMREQGPKLKGGFRGIALTGWQRYDHFSVLCELLPAGLPSLAIDLLSVSHGSYNVSLNSKFFQSLSCPDNYRRQVILNLKINHVKLKVTEKLVLLEKDVFEFLDKAERKKGWLTQYSKDHHFGSPFRIEEIMSDWSRFQHEVISLMKVANSALSEVFDHHTVGEWVELKLYPMYKKLSILRQEADVLKTSLYWEKRPFPVANSILDLGIGVPPTSPPPPSQHGEKRRVYQQPDLYSSKSRLRALGTV